MMNQIGPNSKVQMRSWSLVMMDSSSSKDSLHQERTKSRRSTSWQPLSPPYRLSSVTKAMLDRAMALRLVRDDVIIGSLVPEPLD